MILRDIGHDAALTLAAALAQGSRHSLARAFTAAAPADASAGRRARKRRGIRNRRRDWRAALSPRPGRLRVGALAASASDLDDAVILADDDGAIAAFRVDERLQPGARARSTRSLAMASSWLLQVATRGSKVASVAAALGVKTWAARQTPADKLAWLASLRATGARVVVVGDGVNDAPMLAGADVAVAVSSAADVAQAASDIVVTGELGALAASANDRAADVGDPETEPALGARLQPRHRAPRRAWLRAALARCDRHVGELARRGVERVAHRPRVCGSDAGRERAAVAPEATLHPSASA